MRALLLVCLLFLTGCHEAPLERLHVVTTPYHAPFSFYQQQELGKKLTGLDIDLAHKIAKEMNVPIEIETLAPNDLVNYIAKGKAHFAIAALREELITRNDVFLSTPYYQENIGVLHHEYSKIDLKTSFKGKLGVLVRSDLLEFAEIQQKSHPELHLKQYNDFPTLLEDLLKHKIDAILIQESPGRLIANQHLHRVYFKRLANQSLSYVLVMQKDFRLQQRINSILERLKGDGIIAGLIAKWLGLKKSTSVSESDAAPAPQAAMNLPNLQSMLTKPL